MARENARKVICRGENLDDLQRRAGTNDQLIVSSCIMNQNQH